MTAIKGDFIGFTFDGVHSSELGLTRVSDGSRYSEELLPTIQDKTAEIPGADGIYYFGSNYTQRPHNISVAFDNLTEEQLRQIKKLFGDKGIRTLIYDEVPYKCYRVKTTGTPNLKYVCFEKNEYELDRDYNSKTRFSTKEELYNVGARSPFGRIYKGEGQLNFISYSPYARSRFKYIDEYNIQNIPEWGSMDTASASNVHYNLYDWIDSAGLKLSNSAVTINNITYEIDKVTNSGVAYYNPGDIETHFNLDFYFTGSFDGITIGDPQEFHLKINPFTLITGDAGVRITGSLNLIQGIDAEGALTGSIYNQYIESGDFFKLPLTDELTLLRFSWTDSEPENFNGVIKYDYLYY